MTVLIYERMNKPMGTSLSGARLVTVPQTGFVGSTFGLCPINGANVRPLGPGDGAG